LRSEDEHPPSVPPVSAVDVSGSPIRCATGQYLSAHFNPTPGRVWNDLAESKLLGKTSGGVHPGILCTHDASVRPRLPPFGSWLVDPRASLSPRSDGASENIPLQFVDLHGSLHRHCAISESKAASPGRGSPSAQELLSRDVHRREAFTSASLSSSAASPSVASGCVSKQHAQSCRSAPPCPHGRCHAMEASSRKIRSPSGERVPLEYIWLKCEAPRNKGSELAKPCS